MLVGIWEPYNYGGLWARSASKVQAIVAQQLGKAWSKGAPATGLAMADRHCMTQKADKRSKAP